MYIRHIRRLHGVSLEEQKQIIYDMYKIYNVTQIYIDETSFGQGVVQSLRNKELPVIGCNFHPSKRNAYLINLKMLIEQKRLVIPRSQNDVMCHANTDKLCEELSGFKIEDTLTGQRYVSTTAHDDCVMSLALAIIPFIQTQPKLKKIFYGV